MYCNNEITSHVVYSTVVASELVQHNYKCRLLADRLSLLMGCQL